MSGRRNDSKKNETILIDLFQRPYNRRGIHALTIAYFQQFEGQDLQDALDVFAREVYMPIMRRHGLLKPQSKSLPHVLEEANPPLEIENKIQAHVGTGGQQDPRARSHPADHRSDSPVHVIEIYSDDDTTPDADNLVEDRLRAMLDYDRVVDMQRSTTAEQDEQIPREILVKAEFPSEDAYLLSDEAFGTTTNGYSDFPGGSIEDATTIGKDVSDEELNAHITSAVSILQDISKQAFDGEGAPEVNTPEHDACADPLDNLEEAGCVHTDTIERHEDLGAASPITAKGRQTSLRSEDGLYNFNIPDTRDSTWDLSTDSESEVENLSALRRLSTRRDLQSIKTTSKEDKLSKAYNRHGETRIANGVVLKQILDAALSKHYVSTQKIDLADLLTRVFTTTNPLRSILADARQPRLARDKDLDMLGLSALACIKDDQNRSFKGRPKNKYINLVDHMTIATVYNDFVDDDQPYSSYMYAHLKGIHGDNYNHGIGSDRRLDIGSLIIHTVYGHELPKAEWRQARVRLDWMIERARNLHILEEEFGHGVIIMLSDTSCNSVLRTIKPEVLQEGLQAILSKFPVLKSIFNHLEEQLVRLPDKGWKFDQKKRTFAEFLEGDRSNTSLSLGRLQKVRKTDIIVGSSSRAEPQHSTSEVNDCRVTNIAPVADMIGPSRVAQLCAPAL